MRNWMIGYLSLFLTCGNSGIERAAQITVPSGVQKEAVGALATPVLDQEKKEPKSLLRLPGIEADTIRIKDRDDQFFPALPEERYLGIFAENPKFRSDGFDFPVGKPHGDNYFKARQFGEKKHLGEDWNGVGGGNTDLGDPVYAAGNGLVTYAGNVCCGWGKVIRMVHYVGGDPNQLFVESVYAHLHNMNVKTGDLVRRGKKIGSIGTANGQYNAHLHFELRDFINMSLGPGYSDDIHGYLVPTEFIKANRPAR